MISCYNCVSPLLLNNKKNHTSLLTLLITKYLGVFPTPPISPAQLGVLQFNSPLTLSTQVQHQIPQSRGSVPRLLPLTGMLFANPDVTCASDLLTLNFRSLHPSI